MIHFEFNLHCAVTNVALCSDDSHCAVSTYPHYYYYDYYDYYDYYYYYYYY